MKEALLYEKLEDGRVRCGTCAHGCVIGPGKRGICGVRENQDGRLYSLVYGLAVALHADPIEKKPLFHFLPGSTSLSMATVGCNMHCRNCQNSDISQMPADQGRVSGQNLTPEAIVETAVRQHCQSISYTYTEPAIYWDYAYETARLAHQKNIRNVFVTNGFWSEKSLETMLPFMDAANVDLKFFTDASYKKICGARLEPVLQTIRTMREADVWVEVTTLLIPGLNDSDEELQKIAAFIVSVDPGIPWHVSRFYPTYNMTDRPPTSPDQIRQALKIGKEAGLRFVYAGNLPGDSGEHTLCPNCDSKLIYRIGFQAGENRLANGECPECGETIEGVWLV